MDKIHHRLKEMEESGNIILVHHPCHRKFVDARKKSENFPSKKLRSSISFNWKPHCFFRGEMIDWRHHKDIEESDDHTMSVKHA